MQLIRQKSFHVLILAVVPAVLYFNTLFNKYALDDCVVITENRLTKKGIAGIPDLLSHNLYYGYAQVKVGLYRPFALLTHAVEYEFFGKSPGISHLINLILYALIVLLLYKLLSDYIFKEDPIAAFFAAMIFAVHPIHTEAVANIKGRDELLSLFFLLSTLVCLFRFLSSGKRKDLFFSLTLYLMALLSKENGVTFLLIIPLSLWFFSSKKPVEILKLSAGFAGIAAVYLIIKFYITGFGTDDEEFILNTPFLYASSAEAFATKIFIQFRYVLLLFFPYPLSYDYCYNQIPYVDPGDPEFIGAALILLSLLGFAILIFRKKSVLSFGIFFYFISISIVSNFVLGIGAPMGERFLFQASIGFSIIAGYLLAGFIRNSSLSSETLRSGLVMGILTIVFLIFGYETIQRNKDWKDNKTLFLADVNSAPNSIRTNTNAATTEYFELRLLTADPQEAKKLTDDAITKYSKAISIDSAFPDPYINLIIVYVQENNPSEAENIFLRGKAQNLRSIRFNSMAPMIRGAWNKGGHAWYQKKNLDSALYCFQHAAFMDSTNIEAFYNMGGIYLEKGQGEKTVELWTRVLSLDSGNVRVKELLPRVKRDFNID